MGRGDQLEAQFASFEQRQSSPHWQWGPQAHSPSVAHEALGARSAAGALWSVVSIEVSSGLVDDDCAFRAADHRALERRG